MRFMLHVSGIRWTKSVITEHMVITATFAFFSRLDPIDYKLFKRLSQKFHIKLFKKQS